MTATWDGSLYADNASHHRRYDGDILQGLGIRPDACVVDLGCGVGDLTARLQDLVPLGSVLGVDADPDMVRLARQRHSGTSFVRCTAQQLGQVALPDSVDAVVTVAALHWVPCDEQPLVLGQIAGVLRRGGVLRADLGGHGQIERTRALLDEVAQSYGDARAPWCFPSVDGYAPLLEAAGLDASGPEGWIRLLQQRRPVPDASALAGWLRSQVLIAYRPTMPDALAYQAFCDEVERRASTELRRDDGSYDQDYVRLDLRATRV